MLVLMIEGLKKDPAEGSFFKVVGSAHTPKNFQKFYQNANMSPNISLLPSCLPGSGTLSTHALSLSQIG